MLVVMRPGSPPDEVEAIRSRARQAGADATVFEAVGRTVVGMDGAGSPGSPERLETLRALHGVEVVVAGSRSGPIKTRDLRIESIRPLVPPAILLEQLPLPDAGALTVSRSREEVVRILDGRDDRLLVVVGPCSIHDHPAAREYAGRLAARAEVVRHVRPSFCPTTGGRSALASRHAPAAILRHRARAGDLPPRATGGPWPHRATGLTAPRALGERRVRDLPRPLGLPVLPPHVHRGRSRCLPRMRPTTAQGGDLLSAGRRVLAEKYIR